ncbi:MAG: hypothetical protein IPO12_08550 [Flavobacteriales bacterium]|nr:hypothetical protein [Flavobacteriales bacterium]
MRTITPRTMRSLFTIGMLVSAIGAQAQIGINATGALPNSSAMLDLNSTTRGLLVPRMTGAQKSTLGGTAAEGLIIYQTAAVLDDPDGYWYYDTDLLPVPGWVNVSINQPWHWGGNTGTVTGTNFIGTSNNQGFVMRTNGVERMRLTTAGLVGIGTITPAEQLDVVGAVLVNNTAATNNAGVIRFNAATGAHEGNVDGTANWYQLENVFMKERAQPYMSDPTPACGYAASVALYPTIDNPAFPATTMVGTIETPYSRFWEDGRHQYLYQASDLSTLGICPNTNINGAGFSATSGGGAAIINTQLSMKNTTNVAWPTLDPAGWTVCHTAASFTPVAGWNMHNFNVTPFQWNGTWNVAVEFCFNQNSWTSNVGVNAETTNYTAMYGIYCDACGHQFIPGSATCFFTSCPIGTPAAAGVLCTGYSHTNGCGLLTTSSLNTCDGTFQYVGAQGSANRRPLLKLNAQINTIIPVQLSGDFIYSPNGVVVERTANWGLGGAAPNQRFKGPGTIDAEVGVWGGTVLLSDHVFDMYYDGKPREEDRARAAGYQHYPIAEMANYVEREHHLPTIDGRDKWNSQGKFSLDDINTQLWVTVEEQALYIKELNERMDLLRQHLVRKRLAELQKSGN